MRALRGPRGFLVVLAIVGVAMGARFFSRQSAPLARKSYRIGFDQNPPSHFLQPDGLPGGIAYEVVSDGARRAGIELERMQRQESSEAALGSGQLDLWPLVTDLPERRKLLRSSKRPSGLQI